MPHEAHRTHRRRILGAALAGVCLVGLGTGSAAQLNLGSAPVGSGTAVVGDCQGGAPIRIELTSAWVAGQGFRTTGVVLHGINASCEGERFGVTLVTTSGSALAEAVGVVPAGSATTPVPAATSQTVVTSSVDHAEVVIHT